MSRTELPLLREITYMSQPYTGGCACGAIRYEFSAEPVVMVDCQCRQCQQQTGVGHASYLTFSGVAHKFEGDAKTWEVIGDGGTVKSCAFCPACGSPLYIAFPATPDVFAVRVGSLDDPSRYKPKFVTWHAAAHPWDHLDPTLPKFDGMPPT
jgi:hypothetical protein